MTGVRQRAAGLAGARAGLLAATLLLAPAAAHLGTVNRIVATIDGEPVTLVELENFAAQRGHRAAGDEPPTGDLRTMLDELVLEKIVQKQIQSQGMSASEQQIDAYIASIRERNDLNDAELRAALAQQGLTWEQYRAQVRADIERAALINREIRDKVNVPPEEVERYYNAHLGDYGTPARTNVRLISLLVPAGADAERQAAIRAEAERIRKLAAAGKNFAALAKAHSQGPGAAEGGDLGEITHGQMRDEFEQAISALKPGQVSEVVATEDGYHVLKVEKRAGASHRPLAEVQETIREQLYRQAVEQRYERWLRQDLRARHHVEILL